MRAARYWFQCPGWLILLFRTQAGPSGEHPCHRQPQNRCRASLLKRPRTGVKRRAGRQYIIYQQNAEVVNSGALASGVGATYRLPSLGPGEHQLGRPRPGAHQEVGTEFQPQPFCQRAGDQLGLVVAALAEAVRMQRHRDDEIDLPGCGVAFHHLGQPSRKPLAQPLHAFVLQQHDGAGERVIVNSEAARPLKARRTQRGTTGTAAGSRRRPDRETNGRPQLWHIGCRNRLEAVEASPANRNAARVRENRFRRCGRALGREPKTTRRVRFEGSRCVRVKQVWADPTSNAVEPQ